MRRVWFAVSLAFVCTLPLDLSAADLDWDDRWPRFRVSEGVASGLLLAGGAALNYGLGPPEHGNWRGPILLDAPVRAALAADSSGVAEGYGLASDFATGTLIVYPFAVDSALVGLGLHREGPVALQLALLAVESFAVSTFVMTAGKHLVARQRPPSPDCSREGPHNLYCSDERFESFPSGHTTYAFTGASFLCAAHENLALYGGGWPERLTCWTAIGVATGSGLSRIASDNHYLTDVAAGATLGFASGYLLPKLLHFGWGRAERDAARRARLLPAPGGLAVAVEF